MPRLVRSANLRRFTLIFSCAVGGCGRDRAILIQPARKRESDWSKPVHAWFGERGLTSPTLETSFVFSGIRLKFPDDVPSVERDFTGTPVPRSIEESERPHPRNVARLGTESIEGPALLEPPLPLRVGGISRFEVVQSVLAVAHAEIDERQDRQPVRPYCAGRLRSSSCRRAACLAERALRTVRTSGLRHAPPGDEIHGKAPQPMAAFVVLPGHRRQSDPSVLFGRRQDLR
jgi:hypothetical protein